MFVGIISLIIGLLMILKPEMMLHLEDLFRISGKREYTNYAKIGIRFGGLIFCFIGLAAIFHSG